MSAGADPLDFPSGILVKTTLVDFPGRVAAAFFLRGCNLRCPYCYNAPLVTGGEGERFSSARELFAHLEKRRSVISGLAISGGEPLLNPLALEIIRRAKSMGMAVKIDTNGTVPGALEKIALDAGARPDFIAMDIKTSPARYAEALCESGSPISRADIPALLRESAAVVSSFPSDSREWRTVLAPGLVDEADIDEMARLLPPDASWQFARFQAGGCLDPKFNDAVPYLDSKINALVERAREKIPGAALR